MHMHISYGAERDSELEQPPTHTCSAATPSYSRVTSGEPGGTSKGGGLVRSVKEVEVKALASGLLGASWS